MSRANAALWDAKVAPPTEETGDTIRALYPLSRGPLTIPEGALPQPRVNFNVSDLQRALSSFPAGSSAGPSRLSDAAVELGGLGTGAVFEHDDAATGLLDIRRQRGVHSVERIFSVSEQ